MTNLYKSNYEAYLNSDVWKCAESPSGAHHWVERKKLGRGCIYKCIHCNSEKEIGTQPQATPR